MAKYVAGIKFFAAIISVSLFSHCLWQSVITFILLMQKVSIKGKKICPGLHRYQEAKLGLGLYFIFPAWYAVDPVHLVCMCVWSPCILCRDVCVYAYVYERGLLHRCLCAQRGLDNSMQTRFPSCLCGLSHNHNYFSKRPSSTKQSLHGMIVCCGHMVFLSNSKSNNQ